MRTADGGGRPGGEPAVRGFRCGLPLMVFQADARASVSWYNEDVICGA